MSNTTIRGVPGFVYDETTGRTMTETIEIRFTSDDRGETISLTSYKAGIQIGVKYADIKKEEP